MALFEKELPGNPLCRQNCPRANSYVRLINAIIEESEATAEEAMGPNLFKSINKNLDLRRDSGQSEAEIPSFDELVIGARQQFADKLNDQANKRDRALDQLSNLTEDCQGPIHTEGEDSLGRRVEIWVCSSPVQLPGFARTTAHIEVHGLNDQDSELPS